MRESDLDYTLEEYAKRVKDWYWHYTTCDCLLGEQPIYIGWYNNVEPKALAQAAADGKNLVVFLGLNT